MDAASFFNPTVKKIVVAAVIFALFVPFISYDTGARCIRAPCYVAEAAGSIVTWLIFSYDFRIYSLSYAMIIVGLIASYSISCVINKSKRRAAKK